MSAENAKEMVELLGDITQVGIVIEDMEKAKAGMLKVFGLKPDAESDNLYKKTWYRGSRWEIPTPFGTTIWMRVSASMVMPFIIYASTLKTTTRLLKPWRNAVLPSMWKANRSLTLQRRLRTTTLWRLWASSLRR